MIGQEISFEAKVQTARPLLYTMYRSGNQTLNDSNVMFDPAYTYSQPILSVVVSLLIAIVVARGLEQGRIHREG